MPSTAYIVRALTGAWWLARFDRRGLDLFDLTIDGFWRSFFAAVVALPAYLVIYWTRSSGELSFFVIVREALVYGLDWLILPVVAIFLTRLLGLSNRYVALIIATNWAAVLQFTFFAAMSVLVMLLPETMQVGTYLAGVAIILFYDWFVIRTALDTSISIALGIMMVDLLLGIIMSAALGA